MSKFCFSLEKSDKKCSFYMGLTWNQLKTLHSTLSPACDNLVFWGANAPIGHVLESEKRSMKLNSLQQMVLTLVRLRVGLLTEDLAYRFEISVGYVSKIVTTWIQFLYNEFTLNFKPFMFPSRKIIEKTLPKTFDNMKNIRVLLDCTEFFCESPSNFEHQGNLYSSYKAHTTYKVLVGCTPNGCICFVSDAYEGSISDREIVVKSKFVDCLDPGDLVLADRGFTIHDLVEAKKAHLNIPPFLSGRSNLTAQEEMQTKKIAKQRIYIEHAIGRLKKFRILQRILPLQLRTNISQILFVCACLVNFQKPIVVI